jgi:hypothetical protein
MRMTLWRQRLPEARHAISRHIPVGRSLPTPNCADGSGRLFKTVPFSRIGGPDAGRESSLLKPEQECDRPCGTGYHRGGARERTGEGG